MFSRFRKNKHPGMTRRFLEGYNYAAGELLRNNCSHETNERLTNNLSVHHYTDFDRGILQACKDCQNMLEEKK